MEVDLRQELGRVLVHLVQLAGDVVVKVEQRPVNVLRAVHQGLVLARPSLDVNDRDAGVESTKILQRQKGKKSIGAAARENLKKKKGGGGRKKKDPKGSRGGLNT